MIDRRIIEEKRNTEYKCAKERKNNHGIYIFFKVHQALVMNVASS